MPELFHDCGKRVRFPPGTEGRRGKCPHCGGPVEVPGAPPPREKIQLRPPPHWDEYLAYFEDRGPPPRPVVMPSKLMLATDAEEAWERQAQVRPSKFHCPACRHRIDMDQVICTKCGLDFRTGKVLGAKARLNEKGMSYLEQLPWLEAAREAMTEDPAEAGEDDERKAALRGKAPRPKKRR